ncbi:MAG: apolipoprotein N-acyltransferase [candidate division Zixibacteria bacterium]|nr:apolipoprotein N-acyltransferase [candidate division Zixibacteria bacterium]
MQNKRNLLFITYCSALLGVLAYQPFNFWPAALIFIALLLYAVRNRTPTSAFWIGYLFGVVFYVTLLYWVAWATLFGSLPLPFVYALIPAIFCWLFAKLSLKSEKMAIILSPFIWIALEYIRTLGQIAFPWNPLGNCFAAYPEFIQYAEFTGVWGISLWAFLLNILFYIILKTPRFSSRTFILSGIIIVMMVAPYLYGKSVIPEEIEEGDVEIALLQGNIDREVKWDPKRLQYSFDTYFAMSDSLKNSGVKLIVWPETATPCYLRRHRIYNPAMKNKVNKLEIPILTGTPDYRIVNVKEYVYYNSALYYKPESRNTDKYYKIKLVPFSERIPFSGKMKVLKEIRLGQADFSPGDSLVLFSLDDKRFGVLICFEIVFPDLVRSFVERGADFIVTITNDMWFGVTSGPYQHLYAGTIRAVENRIGIARCANTGISLFYDRYGRTYNMSRLNERKTIIDKVAVNRNLTFYGKHGDYIPKWSTIITIIIVCFLLVESLISIKGRKKVGF